jgi:N-acetylglutamate synthase-like GNAT family acetyltransferase
MKKTWSVQNQLKVKKVGLQDLESTYCCMTELPPGASWSESIPESREWFRKNLGKHVEGYHLLDDKGKVVGHVYYESSEKALLPFETEPKVAFIYCTEMLKEYMHKGYGKTMLDHMKNDLKKQGFKGILVDATNFEEYMHHKHFSKQGFKTTLEHGPFKLMYYPLNQDKAKVKPIKLNYKPSKNKVEVTLFKMSFCPVAVYMHHSIKKVAQTFGDKAKIVEITPTIQTIKKIGTTDPLINGKLKLLGPAKEEDVRKTIQEEIDQFKPK